MARETRASSREEQRAKRMDFSRPRRPTPPLSRSLSPPLTPSPSSSTPRLRQELYKGMIGSDGWCTNYDKSTRTCNIYKDWPFFYRVEPKVFDEFFGVPRSRYDREACSACVDNIKMVYGEDSAELSNFKRVVKEESNK